MPGTLANEINGAGVGLRAPHYSAATSGPRVPWFEFISDNYLGAGGLPLFHLERLRGDFPMAMHGVGLSIGATDPLDVQYLRRLRELADRIQPAWVSDHLCWTGIGGRQFHELLPLPNTEEAVRHVVSRIAEAQERLGRRLLLENVSSYVTFEPAEMTEWEFLSQVAVGADCDLLVDINNIYVNSVNHGFDPYRYVDALQRERVRQLHLAGFEDRGTHLLDSHGSRVHEPVWRLYRHALERWGAVPTCVEWDANLPDYEVLVDEARRAQVVMEETRAAAA